MSAERWYDLFLPISVETSHTRVRWASSVDSWLEYLMSFRVFAIKTANSVAFEILKRRKIVLFDLLATSCVRIGHSSANTDDAETPKSICWQTNQRTYKLRTWTSSEGICERTKIQNLSNKRRAFWIFHRAECVWNLSASAKIQFQKPVYRLWLYALHTTKPSG